MKSYLVRLGVVENAMLRKILKKNPSQQEVSQFLLKMITQEYKRMFPHSRIWDEAFYFNAFLDLCVCGFYALSASVELAGIQDLSHFLSPELIHAHEGWGTLFLEFSPVRQW